MPNLDPTDERDGADVVPLRGESVVPEKAIEELDDWDATEPGDAVLVVDLDPAPDSDTDPADDLAALAEQAVRVGAGLAIGAASFAITTLRKSLGPADRGPPPSTSSLMTGALLAVAAEAALVSSRVVATMVRRLVRAAEPAAGQTRRVAEAVDRRWHDRTAEAEEAAGAAAATVIPDVTRAVLDRLDLTELVAERLDIDEVAAGIDLDRLVERLDLRALIGRLDIDAIVAEVDIDAVIDRVDIAALAREVIDELDVSELIRDSAGGLAGETVDEVRIGSANADRAVARAIDRVLRRRARDLDGPKGAAS